MWYHEDLRELYKSLDSQKEGLSAKRAEENLKRYGFNELSGKKKKSFLRRFFESLCDRMTVVLLIAAAVSFATSYISSEGYADPIIILIIVLVNGLIAVIQESRAEKALEALKKMASPETNVLRDGKVIRIQSRFVHPLRYRPLYSRLFQHSHQLQCQVPNIRGFLLQWHSQMLMQAIMRLM